MTDTDLSAWVGRVEERRDTLSAERVTQLAATLGREYLMDPEGAVALPPCWHWAFFNPVVARNEIGRDGHPMRGGFLPPVPLPRRMWAGSRLEWHGDFTVGSVVDRRSTIRNVQAKTGRAGDIVFVTVGHEYHCAGRALLTEEHDIVYRDDATDTERESMAALRRRIDAREHRFERRGQSVREIDADPVTLFRYSAVTFNGHRIHYDRTYCEQVESYPGLVVHGPLIATLLADWVCHDLHPARRIASFAFRALRPTFDLVPFHLHTDGIRPGERDIEVWASNNIGETSVTASIGLE